METDGIIESGNDWCSLALLMFVYSNLASFSSYASMHSSVDL